jgi:hypothetical protein
MRGLALRKPKLIEIPRVSSGIGMIIERRGERGERNERDVPRELEKERERSN